MGRAGRSGGGGGSRSSGGSHSFSSSRSGSSHSFSSSGRAGRSSSGSSSWGRSSSSSWGRSPSVHVHNHYGGYGGFMPGSSYRQVRTRGTVAVTIVTVVAIVIICGLFAMQISGVGSGITKNTTNRERLELGYGYSSDTLTDELGWIKDPARMNRNLKEFYEDTGAVPYVALVYRPEISSAAQHDYANQWYSEHFDNEGYILLMYFSSGQEDYGTDGECELICGKEAAFLFDNEAQNIFWDCLDHYWYSDSDEDELFTMAFVDTGNRIMQRPAGFFDVMKSLAPMFIILTLAIVLAVLMVLKRKHEAERAAETERILSKPLPRQSASEEDELLDQYSDE